MCCVFELILETEFSRFGFKGIREKALMLVLI